MSKHVAVLMGGWSSERPVSLSSGNACADAVEAAGYRVTRVDVGRDIAEVLARLKPDVAFNALHGPYRRGRLHPGNPRDPGDSLHAFRRSCLGAGDEQAEGQGRDEGGRHPGCRSRSWSTGSKPRRPTSWRRLMWSSRRMRGRASALSSSRRMLRTRRSSSIADDWPHGDIVMVERYVAGRELTCAVRGDEPLDVIDIITEDRFYDYDAKYAAAARNTSFRQNFYQIFTKMYGCLRYGLIRLWAAAG